MATVRTRKKIIRRKQERLTGHANFALRPDHQAAIEMEAQKRSDGGNRIDKSDLYRDAIGMYIVHQGIPVPKPAQVAAHFGPEWVKKNSFEIGGEKE